MTVRELIEKLQEFDGDLEVLMGTCSVEVVEQDIDRSPIDQDFDRSVVVLR